MRTTEGSTLRPQHGHHTRLASFRSIGCGPEIRFCRSEPSAANTDCLLEIWQVNLDGPLHSVRYTHQCLIRRSSCTEICENSPRRHLKPHFTNTRSFAASR
ncbi:hypothetical protein OVA00_32735 [Ensifer sp. SL37]|nr:hypothetical protein [Ensifer adhaerens]MCY1745091.1 hypothetical protein [Ensifer sp. SL37]